MPPKAPRSAAPLDLVKSELLRLRRGGWTDAEVQLLVAGLPKAPELVRLRSYAAGRRQAIRELRRVLRAAEELLAALQAPAASGYGMLSGARVPSEFEAVHLVEQIAFTRRRLNTIETDPLYQPVHGAERADDLRLFATSVLMAGRQLRAAGVAGAPHRDPRPRELLALYLVANPGRVDAASEEAMRQALGRARRALSKA